MQENETKDLDEPPITQPFAKEFIATKVDDDHLQVDDHEDNKKSLAIGAIVIFSFIYLSFQIII